MALRRPLTQAGGPALPTYRIVPCRRSLLTVNSAHDNVQTAERRRCRRVAAAHAVDLFTRRRGLIAHGRTANISETGVFVIVDGRSAIPRGGEVCITICIPASSTSCGRRDQFRTVSYTCRIARVQALGNLLGLGLEFLSKLD
jgi:hypothetical protein